ncbi:MAG: hypothetical protein RMI91_07370 [Gemmatales bacterium]|nr:hypothetical protein [Gemmatales bacterium]
MAELTILARLTTWGRFSLLVGEMLALLANATTLLRHTWARLVVAESILLFNPDEYRLVHPNHA